MSENKVKQLKEELFITQKNGRAVATDGDLNNAEIFCESYKRFLDAAKTEREAVIDAIKMARDKGFSEFDRNKKYNAGDKVYMNNRGKTVAFAVIGSEDIEKGVNICAAHIDSPRLDLKPNPLY